MEEGKWCVTLPDISREDLMSSKCERHSPVEEFQIPRASHDMASHLLNGTPAPQVLAISVQHGLQVRYLPCSARGNGCFVVFASAPC